MAVAERENAVVYSMSKSISRSQMFAVTPDSSNPAYVVLTLLDRAGATGATGTLSGNGDTSAVTSVGGERGGTGFTYQVPTGRYFKAHKTILTS
jgi:hypothetical protein